MNSKIRPTWTQQKKNRMFSIVIASPRNLMPLFKFLNNLPTHGSESRDLLFSTLFSNTSAQPKRLPTPRYKISPVQIVDFFNQHSSLF